MIYSPSPTTVTKRPFGEWRSDVAKISVEPISLVVRGIRVPSAVAVAEGESVSVERVWRLAERTSWLCV